MAHGKTSPLKQLLPESVSPVCVMGVGLNCLLPLQKALQDQKVGLTLSTSPLGLQVCAILCSPFISGVSISHSPVALLKVSPTGLQSQMSWGFIFPVQDLWNGEPSVVLGSLTP